MSSASTGDRYRVTVHEIRDILVTNIGALPDLLADSEESLELLGMDSLAVLELQAIGKERFDIEIPEEALDMSIPEIVAFANDPTRGK